MTRSLPFLLLCVLAMNAIALTVDERDRLQFAANQPRPLEAKRSPIDFPRFVSDDDCGACQTNSPINNPGTTRVIHIRANAVTADGYNLYGGASLDRSDWTFRATSAQPDFSVIADKGYQWFGMKAFYRNGINGTQTESAWAAR